MSLPANPPHTKICIHNSNLYFNLYVSVNWFGWETCGSLETNPESRDVPLPNRLYQVLSTRFSGYYYHHHHHHYYYYYYYYKVAPSSMEWLSIFSLGTICPWGCWGCVVECHHLFCASCLMSIQADIIYIYMVQHHDDRVGKDPSPRRGAMGLGPMAASANIHVGRGWHALSFTRRRRPGEPDMINGSACFSKARFASGKDSHDHCPR